MNKKIIMLVCAFICANNMVFASQTKIITDLMTTGLAAGDNEVYQALVAKYQSKKLTAEDNTLTNITILNKKEGFLKSKMTNKSSLWPYWLAASFGPSLLMTGKVGGALIAFQTYLNEIGYNLTSPISDNPVGFFGVGGMGNLGIGQLLTMPAQLPYYINKALGLPKGTLSTLVYSVAPLMAFYGLYKRYSSMQSQQQELEMVRDMLATLKSFGTPTLN